MDSIPIILKCPSQNKVYNIQITSDITPLNIEQEFKEQCFTKEQNLNFFYNNLLLKHQVPLSQQEIVKGSILLISLQTFSIQIQISSKNKKYCVEIGDFMTTDNLSQILIQMQPFSEVQFYLNQKLLKPDDSLINQEVQANSIVDANIKQQGGQEF
ncbi:unnamed protein product [Paramecium sonneborni]|uniref:Ubiquitin-like domain-containing protein n=1 Tax=Paramecium sonneborni TaxID=65129 RepID=A0A8S1MLW9_9CILI|nr:unnamed protein product [Paramecium sonneborni]